MSRLKSNGTCLLCKKEFSQKTILSHAPQCLNQALNMLNAGSVAKKSEPIFMLKIGAFDLFWLIVEVRGRTTLKQLDAFLRDIWLECCGHLSQFTINGQRYISTAVDDDLDMKVRIDKVLNEGGSFEHIYDFGTSTELTGQVLQVRQGEIEKPIELLAQNHLPELECQTCESHSETICAFCQAPYCELCSTEHTCDESGDEPCFMPLVNSPRAGECGYTGPEVNLAKYHADY